MTEYNEMAHGIAQTNSTVSGHTTTSNDVYVVGYQASNGGSAFLNKYSCNALLGPGGGGGGGGDTVIAAFTPHADQRDGPAHGERGRTRFFRHDNKL